MLPGPSSHAHHLQDYSLTPGAQLVNLCLLKRSWSYFLGISVFTSSVSFILTFEGGKFAWKVI